VQRIIDVYYGWGEGRGILNVKTSGPVERYTLGTLLARGDPSLGMKGSLFSGKKLSFIFVE
jgi:hypothetical protein